MGYKEDMINARESHNQDEKKQAELYSRWLHYRREQFEHAEAHLGIQTTQNLDDLIYIQEKVSEWAGKATEKSRAMFNDVAGAVIRVSAYIVTLESTAKAAVCDSIRDAKVTSNLMKENEKLKTDLSNKDLKHGLEISRLQKEIETLKKQLDFGN